MKIEQRYPKIDAHGFLERAFMWLDSDIDIGIFYAALDLRFTFERMLIKHGFASTNFSKSFEKNNSQPPKLYEALKREFSQRIDLEKAYSFFYDRGDSFDVFGYFLPIPRELFSSYRKLDHYLHAQWAIPIGLHDDKWRKENSQVLHAFAELLIPHANPKNSLDYLSLPNIQLKEVEPIEVENILRKYWIDHPGA